MSLKKEKNTHDMCDKNTGLEDGKVNLKKMQVLFYWERIICNEKFRSVCECVCVCVYLRVVVYAYATLHLSN